MSAAPPKKSKTTPAVILPALVIIALGGALAVFKSQEDDEPRNRSAAVPVPASGQRGGAAFDFYLLAMTLHASFCVEHERLAECRVPQPKPLVIHGLWPERLAPNTYPHDCPAPPLSLEPQLERDLATLMPGMKDGLHEHEWREHGGCSELDDDDYFDFTYRQARKLDAALGAKLATLAGREASAADLRAAADAYERGMGATLTFHCRVPKAAGAGARRRAWLFEVRQCLDDDSDGSLGTPLDCATVDRRDQGCGGRFFIASRR